MENDDILPAFPVSRDFVGRCDDNLTLFRNDATGEEMFLSARFNRHLRKYQRDGIRFLFKNCFTAENDNFFTDDSRTYKGAILADEMGLGKTVQIIGLLSALLNKTQMSSVDKEKVSKMRYSDLDSDLAEKIFLIICPASVLFNWEEELNRWGRFAAGKFHRSNPDMDTVLKKARAGRLEVVLTTYETARDKLDEVNKIKWTCVIVDEVHRIKEPSANVTKSLKNLKCIRRIGLTGTLLQNKYDELWCLLDWANPGSLGSRQHFTQTYSSPIERGLRRDATKGELAKARKLQSRLDEIKNRFVLRRTKEGTIKDQMPKKTDQVVLCKMSHFQRKVFKSLLESEEVRYVLKAAEKCDCRSGKTGLKCCMKEFDEGRTWKQICFSVLHLFLKNANHASLLLPKPNDKSVESLSLAKIAFKDNPEMFDPNMEQMSNPKYSGKMQILVELLESFHEDNANEANKVLLFSYTTRLLNILETFVQSKGFDYRRLDGKTPIEARNKLVHEFNSDSSVFLFLISTKAGGLGLNITGANIVIVFDPNWNPSHDLQAQDRAYRIGQRRDVRVFRLITSGCIEENIYLRQLYKQQLGKNAVDGKKVKRYFAGVQGQKKGELFGIKNLFSVSDATEGCLTSNIIQRNEQVENSLRKAKKRAASNNVDNFQVVENVAENSRGDEEDEEQAQDEGGKLEDLVDDLLDEGGSRAHGFKEEHNYKKKKVEDILSDSSKVVHHHINQHILGSSRAEIHVSEFAVKTVERDKAMTFLNNIDEEPAHLNCDPLLPTQAGPLQRTNSDDGEDDHEEDRPVAEMDLLESNPINANLRADEERIIVSATTGATFLYGQTPPSIRERDLRHMADYLGMTLEMAARKLLDMTHVEKAEFLGEFYSSHYGYEEDIKRIYDSVAEEIKSEENELKGTKLVPDECDDDGGHESDSTKVLVITPPKSGISRKRMKRGQKSTQSNISENECEEIREERPKSPPEEEYISQRKRRFSTLPKQSPIKKEIAVILRDEDDRPNVIERYRKTTACSRPTSSTSPAVLHEIPRSESASGETPCCFNDLREDSVEGGNSQQSNDASYTDHLIKTGIIRQINCEKK